MIDATLEKHLEDSRELQGLWKTFRDYFVAAVRKEPIDPDKEVTFLEIKSRIAMLHDSYLDALKTGQKVAQNIIILVGRSITLRHVSELSEAESKKFEIEWHEAYLQIEETIGMLEEEQSRLEDITPQKFMMNSLKARVKSVVDKTLHSAVFKLSMVALVLIGILAAAIALDAVGKMYDNPSLKPFAITLMAILRIGQPDLEYGLLEEFMPEKLPGNKPQDFDNVRPGSNDVNQREAARLANWRDSGNSFDARDELENAEEFKVQDLHFRDGKRAVPIYYFRLKTSAEAKALMKRFGTFSTDCGKSERDNPPGGEHTFIRKANIIILMQTNEWGAREWMRKNIYKYKIDSDA